MRRRGGFEDRRRALREMSDEQLHERFWQLAHEVVAPLVDLARTHTGPSIERSVVLRMGFSSLEAKAIVDGCAGRGLLSRGAGHVILKLASTRGISVREAGRELAAGRGWEVVESLFRGGVGAASRPEQETRRGGGTEGTRDIPAQAEGLDLAGPG